MPLHTPLFRPIHYCRLRYAAMPMLPLSALLDAAALLLDIFPPRADIAARHAYFSRLRCRMLIILIRHAARLPRYAPVAMLRAACRCRH